MVASPPWDDSPRTVVRTSAPGKLLLFGEHAVVYGCPTIAASLSDLRLRVEIERVAAPSVAFCFRDIRSAHGDEELKRSFALSSLLELVEGLQDERFFLPKPSVEALQRIDNLLQDEHEQDARALRPALFLCCAVLRQSVFLSADSKEGLAISFARDSLPIGAGLGSSAAFCVALSGALAQLVSPTRSTATPDIETINKYAYAAEVILHGAPSGADNTVSAFGGALMFQRRPDPSFRTIRCDLNHFRFLIVNTRVPRSTKVQVAKVRALYEANSTSTQTHFDAIESIVNAFIAAGEREELTQALLASQIEENHRLLNLLGVGHPQIEVVAQICGKHGGATKLTGAGGGGCTISLLPAELSDGEVTDLVKELESCGFECFTSSIGGQGFRID